MVTRILCGEFADGDELPSVRSMSRQMRAHHETIRKAYDSLAGLGVVVKYPRQAACVAEGASEKLRQVELAAFKTEELPAIAERMRLLGLDPDGLKVLLDSHLTG